MSDSKEILHKSPKGRVYSTLGGPQVVQMLHKGVKKS